MHAPERSGDRSGAPLEPRTSASAALIYSRLAHVILLYLVDLYIRRINEHSQENRTSSIRFI